MIDANGIFGARIENNSVRDRVSRQRKWTRISTIDGDLVALEVHDFLMLYPSKAPCIGSKTVIFDGHAVLSGIAISASSNWFIHAPKLLEYVRNVRSSRTTPSYVSGIFSIVVIDHNSGRVDIVLDPLSQYNLFSSASQSLEAYSNNIYFIEQLLRSAAHKHKRSIEGACFEASCGKSAGVKSGIEGVQLVPSGLRVTAAIKRGGFIMCHTGLLPTVHSTDKDTALGKAVESLSQSIAAIQNSMPTFDIVYDLTGGIDSRLVLAASRAAGIRNQTIFRSDGASRHDVLIPDTIAAQFGLKYAGFPQNFDGEDLSLWRLAKRAVFRQQGHSTIYNFELGLNRISKVCRIGGGVGEIVRNYYGVPSAKKKNWSVKQALKSMFSDNGVQQAHYCSYYSRDPITLEASLIAWKLCRHLKAANFLTKSFQANIYKTVREDLKNLIGLEIGNNALLNTYYLTARSRRHFGFTSQTLNLVRPTFEPLANTELWNLANCYSAIECRNGQVIYDLFKKLDKELMAIPMDSRQLRNSTLNFNLDWKKLPEVARPEQILMKSVPELRLPSSDIRSLKNCSGHAAHILPLVDKFFELLFSFEKSNEIWDTLNREAFTNLYHSENVYTPFVEMPQFFMRLFYGLIWVAGLEEECPISREL